MSSTQVIVIGGGSNGLTAAALLAKAGKRVALYESRAQFGGIFAGAEFHPGFRHTGILHESTGLRRSVVGALDLERHGLKFAPERSARLALEVDGPGLLLQKDSKEANAELAKRSAKDVAALAEWRTWIDRVQAFVKRTFDEPAPELAPSTTSQYVDLARSAFALRRLGETDINELLRIGPMCAADWVKDNFETPLLQAGLAFPALEASWFGPWSAGTAGIMLMREACADREVVGGPAAVVVALEKAARAANVDMRCGTKVAQIIITKGRATGVRLENGDELSADCVLSTLEPRHTLIDLIPRRDLPQELEEEIKGWRTRGTTAKMHIAVGGDLERQGGGALPGRLSTGAEIDELERAFDSVKYNECSQRPLLDIAIPTLLDPSLAPAGQHVLSVLVNFAPHALKGGWDDAAKKGLEERSLSVLEDNLPGIRKNILACETLTPVDLESEYGLSGGHLHHGESGLDQSLFLRPSRSCAQYATPIDGLFLGGSGSHPGGGLNCGPGQLAAQRVAEERS